MNHQQLLDKFNEAMRMLDEGREKIRSDFQIECGGLGHVFAETPYFARTCLICGLHVTKRYESIIKSATKECSQLLADDSERG